MRKVKYENETDFTKKLRSLRTYCPFAYKDLRFRIPREELFSTNEGIHIVNLPTSKEFEFLYGKIRFIYEVKEQTVIIHDIEPADFLLSGFNSSLQVYRGMYFRNDKDKFKIDLMFKMEEKNE